MVKEDDDMSDDQKKKAIEELMVNPRSALDEMAIKYGINPVDMPTKRVVAEAIYDSEVLQRKGVETSSIERVSVSVREGGGQVALPGSVSSYAKEGKAKASGVVVEEMMDRKVTSVKGFKQDQSSLARGYRDYKVKEFNNSVKLFRKGVSEYQSAINGQAKKNREYAQLEFAGKIKGFNESVMLYQKSIQTKVKDNELYLKQTYLPSLVGYRNEIRQTMNANQTYAKMDFAKALVSLNDATAQFRNEFGRQIQENHAFRDAFYG